MYVRDLELKSRYLEGECRRLGHLLQCCYSENQALRLSLQSGNAFGASMTKQESAVLLLGKNHLPFCSFFLFSLTIVVVFGRALCTLIANSEKYRITIGNQACIVA